MSYQQLFYYIGSNQVQALLTQLQSQAKLQGLPHVRFNPTSNLPLTITLPGASSEDIGRAQAVLINPQVYTMCISFQDTEWFILGHCWFQDTLHCPKCYCIFYYAG